jgi:hypothetical protein
VAVLGGGEGVQCGPVGLGHARMLSGAEHFRKGSRPVVEG